MKTRRASYWQPHPRLRDVFAGADKRRAFIAYWRRDGVTDGLDYLLFYLLAGLPPHVASRLGGYLARRFAMPRYPAFVARLDANLAHIRPDLDAAARQAIVQDNFDNRGRLMAEFSGLPKLATQGGITSEGDGILTALAQQKRGIILIAPHLSNWEVGVPVFRRLGLEVSSFYQPPRRAAQHVLATRVRRKLGYTVLPVGAAAVRPAMRFLAGGGLLVVFCDEEHQGRQMAPFFGRAPHLDGNLAIATRLARMTGAALVLGYSERRGRGHHVTLQGPLALPSQRAPEATPLQDVAALNAIIEPLIRARPGNWYWLGTPLD